MSPEAIEHINELQQLIATVQTRAVTMAAVIATILGIGLPLIAQSETKMYFHLFPFVLLLASFLLFYTCFSRGIASLKLTSKIVDEGGKKTKVIHWHPYEPNKLEKIISVQYVRKLNSNQDVVTRLEQLLLWRTAISQWAHSFFLAAIFTESIRIMYTPPNLLAVTVFIFLGLLTTVLIKYFLFYKVTGEFSITIPINR